MWDVALGTAFWAASQHFFPLEKATLLDRDRGFIEMGKTLCAPLQTAQRWVNQDLQKFEGIEPHSVVIASYSFRGIERGKGESTRENLEGNGVPVDCD